MAIQIPRIQVQTRDRVGSRYAARLRNAGRLPAVIYGHGQPPVHVSCDRKELTDLLHRRTHLLEVSLDSSVEPCLVKDLQWDHLGSQLVHVDLARVDLNEKVEVEVELALVGEAVGLKEEGAILEHPITMIPIQCLATQIPERIKVDVSALNVGDVMTAKDIKMPEGVTTTLSPETIIATITIIKEEVVEVVPAEGATAEPEVIGRKVEEGAPAEGAEPAKGGAPKAGGDKGGEKK